MSKTSKRRDAQVPQHVINENWARTFGGWQALAAAELEMVGVETARLRDDVDRYFGPASEEDADAQ